MQELSNKVPEEVTFSKGLDRRDVRSRVLLVGDGLLGRQVLQGLSQHWQVRSISGSTAVEAQLMQFQPQVVVHLAVEMTQSMARRRCLGRVDDLGLMAFFGGFRMV